MYNRSMLTEKWGNPKKCWKIWLRSYAMVLPSTILFILFVLYPLGNLINLSLWKGNVRNPYKQYMGIKNYVTLFTTRPDFVPAIRHTAYYTIVVLITLISLSVLCSVWLKKNRRINHFAQSAIFSPHLVASISCAFIWSWMFSSEGYGLFNTVLNSFGIYSVRWLQQTSSAMNCVIVMNVWKNIGYYSLIVMSALKSIPVEIYEAADLDDASGIKQFFFITLPLLTPQLFFMLITITTGSFMVFDSIRVMTAGGPGGSTEVLCTWIYEYAFKNNNTLGLGAAGGVVLMVILLLITALDFKGLEKKVHYQ